MIPGMPKKGEALPAVQSLQQAAPVDPSVAAPSVPVPPPPAVEPPPVRLGSRVQPTIAVTVRLGETRYERMKSWGTARRVTNQDVIVAALDRFFELNEQEREQALASIRK
jgi:hypothetical protein